MKSNAVMPSFSTPTEDRILQSYRLYLLVNAPCAKTASMMFSLHQQIASFIRDPHSLSFNTHASQSLGLAPEPLTAAEYLRILKTAPGSADAVGQDLVGVGSYLVEVCIARVKSLDNSPPDGRLRVLGVSRAEPTLLVDDWEPGVEITLARLRDTIAAMVEQNEIAKALPTAAARKPRSL